jgi:hypothetical protein
LANVTSDDILLDKDDKDMAAITKAVSLINKNKRLLSQLENEKRDPFLKRELEKAIAKQEAHELVEQKDTLANLSYVFELCEVGSEFLLKAF